MPVTANTLCLDQLRGATVSIVNIVTQLNENYGIEYNEMMLKGTSETVQTDLLIFLFLILCPQFE